MAERYGFRFQCPACGHLSNAPENRLQMHRDRCAKATPAERQHFARFGVWPRPSEAKGAAP